MHKSNVLRSVENILVRSRLFIVADDEHVLRGKHLDPSTSRVFWLSSDRASVSFEDEVILWIMLSNSNTQLQISRRIMTDGTNRKTYKLLQWSNTWFISLILRANLQMFIFQSIFWVYNQYESHRSYVYYNCASFFTSVQSLCEQPRRTLQ